MPRINAELNDKLYNELSSLAENSGKSKAEVLRIAIALLAYHEERKKHGESLAIINDDKIKRVLLVL